MKTIEEVLEYAEHLNKTTPKGITLNPKIEGLNAEDIKALCEQENGTYFKGDNIILPSDWCSVTLGRIDFILSSKKQVKVKSIF